MQKLFPAVIVLGFLFSGCQINPGNTNINTSNANTNLSNALNTNSNSNANLVSTDPNVMITEAKEPEQYQATVALKLEATGEKNAATLPTISANVARSGGDRRMEFNLPNGEKVVYLDKGGMNYLILPKRKQFALLDKDAMGFEVRQMMMPEQIVDQIKTIKGVERVGEENLNGRPVIKYRYSNVTETNSQAGQVTTESFFLIDKETGLPVHTETMTNSQNADVKGYKGLRLVTEMTDIKTDTAPDFFELPPPEYQKIKAEEVKAQVDLIFNAIALLLEQAVKSAEQKPATTPAASPSVQ